MSLELEIGELQLTFEGVALPEHRAAAISRRAIALLDEIVNRELLQMRTGVGERALGRVSARPVNVDVAGADDEKLARLVAQAMFGALVERLRV